MEKTDNVLTAKIEQFLKASFKPAFGQRKETFQTNRLWQKLGDTGTELWLDTGSITDAEELWTQQFSALTTNNTLLNRVVQTGCYDLLIGRAAGLLDEFTQLTDKQRMLELAFILNAWHGLRLVEKFDAYVSVEEHTDLANDVEMAVDYARRYYAVCPERFIIKLPFTPAGLLGTRRLSAEGIPINHTLGFSARQNYLIARIGKPAYVNVFLGRLNSFIKSNNLGDGSYIGEKATLASQAAVKKLRQANMTGTRQIAASFREASQVTDLAGVDVMTIPPKVAGQFLCLNLSADQITDKTAEHYNPGINDSVDPQAVRLNTLWDVGDELVACVDILEKEDIDSFGPDDLIDFFKDHNCPDLLVRWSDSQIQTSIKEGKIPKLENWRDALAEKKVGLDSLMNLGGMNSFTADQAAMDGRVRSVLAGTTER